MAKLKMGQRVRVAFGAGLDSGRRGRIVDRRRVPTDGRGVPQLGQGHYKPLGAEDCAIEDEKGNLFTMNSRFLVKDEG